MATARQVRDQDVDLAGPAPALRRGVAKERRISVEDAQMRHGRKSRSVLFDGYKRHVLRDLDTGLVTAAGITPANVPEARVTNNIAADLDAAGLTLAELHIDRAYLASDLVREREPGLADLLQGLAGPQRRPLRQDQFTLDLSRGPSPARWRHHAVRPGRTVHFPAAPARPAPAGIAAPPAATGAASPSTPTRHCWPSCASASRPPRGAPKLRERVAVEHALAHVGHWQGRRARYRGTRKNLFDLRRVAVVHNLHVIARQPDNSDYQLAA